ncbi:selection and upkeep of intraepithelial T-cells protein 7 [Oreochromis niloticus]|uniref:selection and upkeep of intraepithelial T-cells protein 7 n=1 Tax=Oreochromis niloticus TaxID=8128 RepID=UPI000393F006|nr:selection and upkeep of intraepithelial T-cells protein 7 [Oreochromis niloticus]
MAAGTSASLCCLIFVGIFVFVSAVQQNITVELGKNVNLTCRAPNNNIRVVKWSRADLGDKNVFLYRDGRSVPNEQHPSFKNRVDLQDRQMKDGNVSLILNNVTINDPGTYDCQVFLEEKRSWELISIISLSVVPPGQTGGREKDEDKKDGGKEDKEKEEDGSVGLKVGLSVSAVLLVVAVVGFLIYRKREKNKESRAVPDFC